MDWCVTERSQVTSVFSRKSNFTFANVGLFIHLSICFLVCLLPKTPAFILHSSYCNFQAFQLVWFLFYRPSVYRFLHNVLIFWKGLKIETDWIIAEEWQYVIDSIRTLIMLLSNDQHLSPNTRDAITYEKKINTTINRIELLFVINFFAKPHCPNYNFQSQKLLYIHKCPSVC